MHSTHLAFTVLLLLPCLCPAQDTLSYSLVDHHYFGPVHFANAKDSAEFTQFRKGVRTIGRTLPIGTTTHYRMVWQENQHGGLWSVGRGDGSLPKYAPNEEFELFIRLPFLTPEGRRGLMIVHEIPCGLICRTAWYYVEE
jgi:hypothetical protein